MKHFRKNRYKRHIAVMVMFINSVVIFYSWNRNAWSRISESGADCGIVRT